MLRGPRKWQDAPQTAIVHKTRPSIQISRHRGHWGSSSKSHGFLNVCVSGVITVQFWKGKGYPGLMVNTYTWDTEMVRQEDLEFEASLCYMENSRIWILQSASYKPVSKNKTKWTKTKIRKPQWVLTWWCYLICYYSNIRMPCPFLDSLLKGQCQGKTYG